MFLLCLVSCATTPKISSHAPVYLTDRAKYTLLPPADIAVPLDHYQRISGTYGGQEFSFDAWVAADDRELVMAILSPMGTSLGELSFGEGGLSFSSAFFPPTLKPEYVVADFQLCFYRVDAVSQALKNCGLGFRTEGPMNDPGGSAEIRVVSDGNRDIIEIEKTKNAVRYINHVRGYAYTLEGDF